MTFNTCILPNPLNILNTRQDSAFGWSVSILTIQCYIEASSKASASGENKKGAAAASRRKYKGVKIVNYGSIVISSICGVMLGGTCPSPPPQEKKMAVWMFHDGLNLDAPTHVVTHRKDHVDLLLLMFLCCALGIGSQISFVCDLFLKTCSEKPSNVFLSYPNGCERTRRDCESLTANKYNCIQLAQAFFQDHKNCM